MGLFDPAVEPRRSRVHGGRRILHELCRLRKKVSDAFHVRAKTDAERRWYLRLGDRIDESITEGNALNFPLDPRDTRRVRKRKDQG
jgi:hypothetical protein